METMFLFEILGEGLFIIMKVVGEDVLFPEGFPFDLLFIFENLIDR
jgi:hypothetical protein